MRIRITRDSATSMVAVSALDDDAALAHTVRFVDPEVGDALEDLLSRLPFGGATGLNPTTDLDALLDQAHAAVRERTRRHDGDTSGDVTQM